MWKIRYSVEVRAGFAQKADSPVKLVTSQFRLREPAVEDIKRDAGTCERQCDDVRADRAPDCLREYAFPQVSESKEFRLLQHPRSDPQDSGLGHLRRRLIRVGGIEECTYRGVLRARRTERVALGGAAMACERTAHPVHAPGRPCVRTIRLQGIPEVGREPLRVESIRGGMPALVRVDPPAQFRAGHGPAEISGGVDTSIRPSKLDTPQELHDDRGVRHQHGAQRMLENDGIETPHALIADRRTSSVSSAHPRPVELLHPGAEVVPTAMCGSLGI